jgi:DNA-binding transcriptional MerR regulator
MSSVTVMLVEHSISQVARMAGISARTLRHYQDIGLLTPSRISTNGYRWYERPQLLRLQQILLLKQMDVPLPRIAEILDGAADELTALHRHRQHLIDERDRVQQIIDTVDRTIQAVSGQRTVTDTEFFTGLAGGRNRLREDLAARFGSGVESHFNAATRATSSWSRQDYERAAEESRHLLQLMSNAQARGVAPTADEAVALVAEHHQDLTAIWPAGPAAYHAFGELIIDNPEQRTMIAEIDPDLPPWLSAAIKSYAIRQLGHNPTP